MIHICCRPVIMAESCCDNVATNAMIDWERDRDDKTLSQMIKEKREQNVFNSSVLLYLRVTVMC